ncbi:hypothetical protein GCM10023107_19890 [Actinoplanes octamycinicus]
MSDVVIQVRLIDPDLPLPAYAHPGDAGADLVAAEEAEIAPGARSRSGPASRSPSRTASSGWSTHVPDWPRASG